LLVSFAANCGGGEKFIQGSRPFEEEGIFQATAVMSDCCYHLLQMMPAVISFSRFVAIFLVHHIMYCIAS
jgi:hypothetical protein